MHRPNKYEYQYAINVPIPTWKSMHFLGSLSTLVLYFLLRGK